jgi:hypothetical protein
MLVAWIPWPSRRRGSEGLVGPSEVASFLASQATDR